MSVSLLTFGLGSYGDSGLVMTLGLESGEEPPPAVDANSAGFPQLGRIWRERYEKKERLSKAEAEKVAQAVLEAAHAEIAIAEAVDRDLDIAAALAARRHAEAVYLQAYKAALLERFMEAAILERFRGEVAYRRLEIMRRAALLLLLSS